MKILFLMTAGLMLAACAGPTYYPAQPSGEGGYYIARSPATVPMAVDDAAYYYRTFAAYGFNPWWSYGYYSPYFYPHYFAVWQPGWPNYGGSFGGWYGHYPHRLPPRGPLEHRPPLPPPAGPQAPVAGLPFRPAPPTVLRSGPVAQPALYREIIRQGGPRWSAGPASAEQRPEPLARPSVAEPAGRGFNRSDVAPATPGFRGAPRPLPAAPGGMAGPSRDPLRRAPPHRDP